MNAAEFAPFEPHWLETDGARLHYVDEGAGPPIVLLHGNPTWSFVYRHVIRGLSGECRCIAPDYPGFGRSEAPEGFEGAPEQYAKTIGRFLDELGLDRFSLVLHDWGGPIGLSAALDRPDRLAGLVVLNSWAWAPGPWIRAYALAAGTPPARWLQARTNLVPRLLLRIGTSQDTPDIDAYTAPLSTPERRARAGRLVHALRASAGWLDSIERRLHALAACPAELVWGMRDPALGWKRYIERWRRHLPAARVDRIRDASHFVPEDRPDRVAAAVRRVLERI